MLIILTLIELSIKTPGRTTPKKKPDLSGLRMDARKGGKGKEDARPTEKDGLDSISSFLAKKRKEVEDKMVAEERAKGRGPPAGTSERALLDRLLGSGPSPAGKKSGAGGKPSLKLTKNGRADAVKKGVRMRKGKWKLDLDDPEKNG